jgi:hypothetical protein
MYLATRAVQTWLGPVPIDTVYGREWLLDDRAKKGKRTLQADVIWCVRI